MVRFDFELYSNPFFTLASIYENKDLNFHHHSAWPKTSNVFWGRGSPISGKKRRLVLMRPAIVLVDFQVYHGSAALRRDSPFTHPCQ